MSPCLVHGSPGVFNFQASLLMSSNHQEGRKATSGVESAPGKTSGSASSEIVGQDDVEPPVA